jgi:hypothetical protein
VQGRWETYGGWDMDGAAVDMDGKA